VVYAERVRHVSMEKSKTKLHAKLESATSLYVLDVGAAGAAHVKSSLINRLTNTMQTLVSGYTRACSFALQHRTLPKTALWSSTPFQSASRSTTAYRSPADRMGNRRSVSRPRLLKQRVSGIYDLPRHRLQRWQRLVWDSFSVRASVCT
jgi:hypothetical protein